MIGKNPSVLTVVGGLVKVAHLGDFIKTNKLKGRFMKANVEAITALDGTCFRSFFITMQNTSQTKHRDLVTRIFSQVARMCLLSHAHRAVHRAELSTPEFPFAPHPKAPHGMMPLVSGASAGLPMVFNAAPPCRLRAPVAPPPVHPLW